MKSTSAIVLLLLALAPAAQADVVIVNNTYSAVPAPLPYPPALSSPSAISSPAPNARLSAPPDAVTVTFSQPPRAEGSAITVYNSGGAQVAGGGDVQGNVLSVPLSALPAGKYRVKWQAKFAGGPRQRNSFYFTIRRH